MVKSTGQDFKQCEIYSVVRDGLYGNRQIGIKTFKMKDNQKKMEDTMSHAMAGVRSELKRTKDIITSIENRQE